MNWRTRVTIDKNSTALGTRNFAVAGAKIWNSLPAELRLHLQSLQTFGQRLKRYLFECHERI